MQDMNQKTFHKQCSLFLLAGGGDGEDDGSRTFVEGEAVSILIVNTPFRKLIGGKNFPPIVN